MISLIVKPCEWNVFTFNRKKRIKGEITQMNLTCNMFRSAQLQNI